MKKKGFTLIELLVVISIIALLLSILMPSLTKAKEQAMILVCKSNFKQIGAGIHTYISSNNDRLPPTEYNLVKETGSSQWAIVHPEIMFRSFDFADNPNKLWAIQYGRLASSGIITEVKSFFCPYNNHSQYLNSKELLKKISDDNLWTGMPNYDDDATNYSSWFFRSNYIYWPQSKKKISANQIPPYGYWPGYPKTTNYFSRLDPRQLMGMDYISHINSTSSAYSLLFGDGSVRSGKMPVNEDGEKVLHFPYDYERDAGGISRFFDYFRE